MKIAYDCRVFRLQPEGGISRYFCDLYREISTEVNIQTKISAPLHVNRHLTALCAERHCGEGWKMEIPIDPIRHPKGMRLVRPVIDIAGALSMSRFKPDIHHRTYYSAGRSKGAKVVVTVFDMIHELYRERFKNPEETIELKRRSIESADAVICISESTRRDLVSLYPKAEYKSRVVHLGINRETFTSRGSQVRSDQMRVPFFLFVGQRRGYKNFEGAIEALDEVKKSTNQEIGLVCFGGGRFVKEDFEIIDRFDIGVRQESGSDDKLAHYYRLAEGLLYTSEYEGFGLPVLEAMACGCPVICSSSSSLPEVGGDAAIQCNVRNAEDIARGITLLLFNEDRRRIIVERGKEHIESFSWSRCASETMSVYRQLA